MCGIVGCAVSNPNHIKRDIVNVYRNQQYRGKSGFGLCVKHVDGKIERVRTKYEHEIFKDSLWDEIENDDLLLFHHRTPTSSPNLPNCNHPLTNSSQTIYLVHNGIISGYDELSDRKFESAVEVEKAPRFGWQFHNQFTDSELCLHRLNDLLLKNDMLEAVKMLGEENYFSAFLIFHADEHKIYFTSNGADLSYYKFGDNKFISSIPYVKTYKGIENTYGYIDGKENVIQPLEVSSYPTYLPQYCGSGYNSYGGFEDEAEENFLLDNKRDIIDSHLFTRYKQEHGCCDICMKCDYLEDCLDLFREWRHEEFQMGYY